MAIARTRETKTQSFYDQIADIQHLAQRLIGYRTSLTKYLASLDLKIASDSLVLDAGCGTGLATLALHSAGYRPRKTFALDLSFNSLTVAREQFVNDRTARAAEIEEVQGNLLSLPFEDESFDVILTCGALEYVPLDDGMQELARVLKPNGMMILIPVRPSPISAVLEIIYNFKTHSIREIRRISGRYFNFVSNHKFPITEPISWSKTSFLLQKK
jgi:Methylase involved in ubiquinone/menaquinone biosynthesis